MSGTRRAPLNPPRIRLSAPPGQAIAEEHPRRPVAQGPEARASASPASVLQEAASEYAVYGVLIAAAAVIIATTLVAWLSQGTVDLAAIVAAQRGNIALWTMDAMPFIFAMWGQYASSRMAREAKAFISDHTRTLDRALAEARHTNQVKTDFFARMSHELRTPLNAIMGMAELLFEPGTPAEVHWNAQIIRESAQNLLTLINDVLDIAKIEAGRLELEHIEFNLRDCVRGAVALLEGQATRKGLRLTSLVAPNVPARAVGDPGRLRQIIINLVGNAIKYTNQGEVVFSLARVEASERAALNLRIEVADTGIGIPSASRRDLFKPYGQVGQAAVRRGGTGLGLAITRELVEAMQGQIGVASDVGKGSTFWCTLRLSRCPEGSRPQPASVVTLDGTRVLLADPNGQTRRILGDQLRALGMEVETAAYSADALAAVRSAAAKGNPFQIVVLDMFLPGMGGEELGMRLAVDEATSDALRVIITSAGARGDVERMARKGFAAYLTRPVPPGDLKPLFSRILGLRELDDAERRRAGLITRHSRTPVADHDTGNHHVLLVEDSDAGLTVAQRRLSAMGLTTDVARNGQETLEAVAQGHYAAVLLDLRLPDMSGTQVLQRIRALEGAAGAVPVIIMTAGATDAEQTRCRELGVSAILYKPLEHGALEEALGDWIALPAKDHPFVPEPTDEPRRSTVGVDAELIRIFVRESDQRVIAMHQASTDEAGRRQIARDAHTISSTSRHFGDDATTQAAGRVEALAPDAAEATLNAAIEALTGSYRRLRRRLRTQLEATSGKDASSETAPQTLPPST